MVPYRRMRGSDERRTAALGAPPTTTTKGYNVNQEQEHAESVPPDPDSPIEQILAHTERVPRVTFLKADLDEQEEQV